MGTQISKIAAQHQMRVVVAFLQKKSGWWAIDPAEGTGQIDHATSGTPGGLANEVRPDPTGEKRYNGDGPADIMGAVLDDIDLAYRQAWGRPAYPEEVEAVFEFVFRGAREDYANPPADDGGYVSWPLNRWVDETALFVGVTTGALMQLPWEKLQKLRQWDIDKRNGALGGGSSASEKAKAEAKDKARMKWEKRVKSVIEVTVKKANVRITLGEVRNRLKKDLWRNDRHDRSYDMRTAEFYSIYITQRRHNGTKDELFQVTWYTGVPSKRWGSRTVDTIKEAVRVANQVKPESDRISAEELGESPEGKLAKAFKINIGDPILTGKFLNSPGIVVGFGKTPKGDPTVIIEKGKEGGGAKKTVKLFKVRYDKGRAAAQVGTDTAAIYAIEPGQLAKLIDDGDWAELWDTRPGDPKADKLIRQNGGAVFLTGADGIFNVEIPDREGYMPIVSEKGYMAPYGTPGNKSAGLSLTAAWDALDAPQVSKRAGTTGDGHGVGLFFRLPEELASTFPSLGSDDDSPPHVTFLYVGAVTPEQQTEFLEITRGVFSSWGRPTAAHHTGLKYFQHPEKDRSVAIQGVRFGQDMAGLRWRLRDALMDAGFDVQDSFPLIYKPHTTLAYQEGMDTKFQGPVPGGRWPVTEAEVWGLPQVHTIPLGGLNKTAARPIRLPTREIKDLAKKLTRRLRAWGLPKPNKVVAQEFFPLTNVRGDEIVVEVLLTGSPRRHPDPFNNELLHGGFLEPRPGKDPRMRVFVNPYVRSFEKTPARIVEAGLYRLLAHELTHGADIWSGKGSAGNLSDSMDDFKKQHHNHPAEVRALMRDVVTDVEDTVSSYMEVGMDFNMAVREALLDSKWPDIEPYLTPKNKKIILKGVHTHLRGVEKRTKGGKTASRYPTLVSDDENGKRWFMDVKRDQFVHFTTSANALAIMSSGKLLVNPPDKISIVHGIYAVSTVWGEFVPSVQTYIKRQRPDNPAVAILFRTNNKPESGNFVEEVSWDRDVTLRNAKIISVEEGIQRIKQAPFGGQIGGDFGEWVEYERGGGMKTAKAIGPQLFLLPSGAKPNPRVLKKTHKLRSRNVNKPSGGFWTSLARGTTSDWLDWCGEEFRHGEQAWILDVLPGADVYQIRNQKDVDYLLENFPHKNIMGETVIDWASLGDLVDGIHVTRQAVRLPALDGWDVESTVWTNPKLRVRQLIDVQRRCRIPEKPMVYPKLDWEIGKEVRPGVLKRRKPWRRVKDDEWDKFASKFKNKKQVDKADGSGKTTIYEYSDGQIGHRNREKAKRIEGLRKGIWKLRSQVAKDLTSKDESTRLTALAIALIDETFERVGNPGSAKEGHYGVTGWLSKHVKVSGSKATLNYVGKSGVKQTKTVSNAKVVTALKAAIKAGGDAVCDGDDCTVTSGEVNAYLKPFKITAKDMRGFHANTEMQTRLKAVRSKGGKLPTDEKEKAKKLKDEFKTALEETAEAVGHEASTLKSQYLVPGLEDGYLKGGKVNDKLDKQGSISQAILTLQWKQAGDVLRFPPKARRTTGPTLKIQGTSYALSDYWSQMDMAEDSRVTMGLPVGKHRYLWAYDTDRQLVEMWRVSDGEPKDGGRARQYSQDLLKLDKKGQLNRVTSAEFKAIDQFMRKRNKETLQNLKEWARELETGYQKKVNGLALTLFNKEFRPEMEKRIADVKRGALPFDFKVNPRLEQFGEGAEKQAINHVVGGVLLKFTEDAVWKELKRLQYDPDTLDQDIQAPYWAVGDIKDGVYEELRTGRPFRFATKSQAEKEDQETERLVRPEPKKKPPRKDLRRERMKVDDKDIEDMGADGQKDLSLNYKKVAADPPHKSGDVWQSEAGNWVGMNPEGHAQSFTPDAAGKGKAKAWAQGEDTKGEEEDTGEKGKGEEEEGKGEEEEDTPDPYADLFKDDPEMLAVMEELALADALLNARKKEPAEGPEDPDEVLRELAKEIGNPALAEEIIQEMQEQESGEGAGELTRPLSIDEGLELLNADPGKYGLGRPLKEDEYQKWTEEAGLSDDGEPLTLGGMIDMLGEEVDQKRDFLPFSAEAEKVLKDRKEQEAKNFVEGEREDAKAEAVAEKIKELADLVKAKEDKHAQGEVKKVLKSLDSFLEGGAWKSTDVQDNFQAAMDEMSSSEQVDFSSSFQARLMELSAPPADGFDRDALQAATEAIENPLGGAGLGPSQKGEALAAAVHAKTVLANPRWAGGREIQQGYQATGEELDKRAQDAYAQYAQSTPALRKEAVSQLAAELDKLPLDAPEREELERVADALALSAAANGETMETETVTVKRDSKGDPLYDSAAIAKVQKGLDDAVAKLSAEEAKEKPDPTKAAELEKSVTEAKGALEKAQDTPLTDTVKGQLRAPASAEFSKIAKMAQDSGSAVYLLQGAGKPFSPEALAGVQEAMEGVFMNPEDPEGSLDRLGEFYADKDSSWGDGWGKVVDNIKDIRKRAQGNPHDPDVKAAKEQLADAQWAQEVLIRWGVSSMGAGDALQAGHRLSPAEHKKMKRAVGQMKADAINKALEDLISCMSKSQTETDVAACGDDGEMEILQAEYEAAEEYLGELDATKPAVAQIQRIIETGDLSEKGIPYVRQGEKPGDRETDKPAAPPRHEPGDVWETKENKQWSGKNKKGLIKTFPSDEEGARDQAEAWSKQGSQGGYTYEVWPDLTATLHTLVRNRFSNGS